MSYPPAWTAILDNQYMTNNKFIKRDVDTFCQQKLPTYYKLIQICANNTV